MNKENIWLGFFVNMLGIILGIIITFGSNALWQQYEEQKRTREMLILVRNELITNKHFFKYQEKTMQKERLVFKKILEAEKEWSTIPEDTLKAYRSAICNFSMSTLTTSAWQIFQNSEMIQKMSNKELVIMLTETYFAINASYDLIMKFYWDKKLQAIPSEIDVYDFFDAWIDNKESLILVHAFSQEDFLQTLFVTIDAIIDFNILLLDRYGDFKYDTNETEEEFKTFYQTRLDSVLLLSQNTNRTP